MNAAGSATVYYIVRTSVITYKDRPCPSHIFGSTKILISVNACITIYVALGDQLALVCIRNADRSNVARFVRGRISSAQ